MMNFQILCPSFISNLPVCCEQKAGYGYLFGEFLAVSTWLSAAPYQLIESNNLRIHKTTIMVMASFERKTAVEKKAVNTWPTIGQTRMNPRRTATASRKNFIDFSPPFIGNYPGFR